MEKNDYILVLPSWYPNITSSFNGDFNERFVQSVSSYRKQIVLFVVQKKGNQQARNEFRMDENISTYIVYYNPSNFFLINLSKYFFLNYKYLSGIFKEFGKPSLVHNYVFFPAGMIAYFLKWRYGLKTVLTEHWTIFYKERVDFISRQHWIKKWIYKKILNSYDAIISVAKRLEDALIPWSPKSIKYVLPNVVNSRYFNCVAKTSGFSEQSFTFIHVSSLRYQKNIIGLLSTFEKLIKEGHQIKLTLVGLPNEELENKLTSSVFLKENVDFKGILTYSQVAKEMQKADAFVLFSRYENMPCVLLEALCCGLPLIATDVGGISEIITPENGLLIENENEAQLKAAIETMVYQFHRYNKKEIAEEAIEKCSFETVGKKIDAIYRDLA